MYKTREKSRVKIKYCSDKLKKKKTFTHERCGRTVVKLGSGSSSVFVTDTVIRHQQITVGCRSPAISEASLSGQQLSVM